MKASIIELITEQESPTLEFKRQWYWDDTTPATDMADLWGELIKDIISLSNGYLGHTGRNRHLVIGYSETERKPFNIGISKIKQLQNLTAFKKDLIRRLEKYTTPSLTDINIETTVHEGCTLLIIELPVKGYITELKTGLKTKTRHIDEGGVLIRKGQKTDEVRTATPSEYQNLKEEFESLRRSDFFARFTQPEPEEQQTERSIEKTVQLFMDKNSSLSLVEKYPVRVKNWKDSIIYEVYKLTDGFDGGKEFIYIHDSSNQGKTVGEIKSKNYISKPESSIILIDRPNLKDIGKRKENISRLFGTKFVYFVDEFGCNFLYKDCMLPYEKFNLPIYVNGLYDLEEERDLPALEKLKEWYNTENEPLFIVSGHGGIGKTTLAKQFLDQIYTEENDQGLLFIDSKEIINELSRNSKISDVFDFYRAQMDVDGNDSSRFNKDLLKLSIDNGSLTVVLDGIDEVIAKLGNRFDVQAFITSIFQEYSSDLHKTKVLITCRDHFWNEVGKKILLPEIVLKAFNADLAQDFFNQKLKGDKKRITNAMLIADKLAIETRTKQGTTELFYIPFLLDMIGYLINSRTEDINLKKQFASRYLSTENHVDFLIAQVCDREIIKLGGLTVDQQIELFIRIAISKDNGVDLYDIKQELQKIVTAPDNALIEKIKGHTLLVCSDNGIHFRYDVFDVYFAALHLVYFFKQRDITALDEQTARVISGYLKYDSSFTESVCERIEMHDDLVLFCIEVIESAASYENPNTLISSIVSLLLCLLQKSDNSQSSTHTRTELIEKLFLKSNELVGISLIDIFGNSSIKPTFDFKDRVLRDCTFDNYEYFWECQMNEGTKFENSQFKDINPRSGVTIKLHNSLFSSTCDLTQIQHLLTEKEEEAAENKEAVLTELEKVFKLFYQRGNFYPRKQEEVRKKLSAVNFLPHLLEKGVLKNYKDPKKPTMRQFKVSDEYKSVIDYFEQGSPSIALFRLAEELS
ncbi:NACHT domain-containing protein [Pseudomonas leptonychotis]|uniref:NACHT domain-containing protein n=1 Tax=Pseudomonas leptonychotis TaxID=2448482 RepID=A0A4T2A1Y2_9PSED|nr:NACHT domain-containing protein [Pseudomonas leptonychotis]TIH11065.1 NACHT domain-containing protein [Pseudomonas leptonychotis]